MSSAIQLHPLSTLSFADALLLWNAGFQGYAVDMKISLDRFVGRLYSEGLSPEKSLVAIVEGQPVGFLLTGIRSHAGKLVAWNGGTGVVHEFRGKGIGRALVEAALAIYANENVDYATLEAITTNTPAIELYRKFGYATADELTFLEHEGTLESFGDSQPEYIVKLVTPREVAKLRFYKEVVPWQAQWQSITNNGGQGLIISNVDGVEVGYALFRRHYNERGDLTNIALHQCVVKPERDDKEIVVAVALEHVFGPLSVGFRRTTHNFEKMNRVVMDVLQRAGFVTTLEQLFMVKVFA